MSLFRSVAHNTIIQFASKFGSIALGVVTIAIMARALGVEGFGYYSTIVAYLQFFGILVDFGLQLSMVNMMSNPNFDELKIYRNTMTLRIFSALILFAIAPLVILLFPYNQEIKTGVLILTLNFFALALNQILIGLFQKKLQIIKTAAAELVGKTLTLLGVIYAVYTGQGLLTMLLGITLAGLIQVAILFALSGKLYEFKFAFEKEYWKKIVSASWPIALSIAFNLIYFKADTLILSLTRTQTEVGIYAAPYRVLEILTQFPYLFVGLVFPLIAQAWSSKNMDQYKYWFQKTFDALIIAAIPLIAGTYILAQKIMVFIAGDKFIESGRVLQIIIFATAIIFVNVVFGYSIVILGKQKQLISGYALTALLSIALYLIFIPKYSIYAAAWITVFSETLIFLINLFVSIKTSGFSPKLGMILKSMAASLIMVAGIYLTFSLHILITLITAFIVYALSLYLFKGYSKNTIKEIMSLKS